MNKESLWVLLAAAVALAAWEAVQLRAQAERHRRQLAVVVRGAKRAIESGHDEA